MKESVSIGVSRGYWKEISEKGEVPSPRSGHSSLIFQNAMYIFGGANTSQAFNDHYRLNLATCAWERLNGTGASEPVPKCRTSHGACIDELTATIYVHGGSGVNFGYSNESDMFSYSIRDNLWQKIQFRGSYPEARYGHSISVYKDSLYLFGGTNGFTFLNDFYLFQMNSYNWILLTLKKSPPIPRYKHTARVQNNILLIIGGTKEKEMLTDVYKIDLDTLDSFKIEGPESGFMGKCTHSAEIYKNDVYILGISSKNQCEASLWKFSLKSNKWKEVIQFGTRPPAMVFFTMIMCSGYIIIFGGNINNARTNKTFVFRLSIFTDEWTSPLSSLYDLAFVSGMHSDVTIQGNEGTYFCQSLILHVRAPLLYQHIQNNFLKIEYPDLTVKALLLYIYNDLFNPLLPLGNILHLLSISSIFAISPLLNRICLYLSHCISPINVKEIVNYIAKNSIQMLLHRNEFRQNVDSYTLNTPMDELLKKKIIDSFELSSGEKVYWICIDTLVHMKNFSGVIDSVNADVLRLKEKNAGKNIPQRTASYYELSNLRWCLSLVYNSEKDFVVNCEGKKIPVHKFMLIGSSEYFQGYFSVMSDNDKECEVDVPAECMTNIVKYIYLGTEGVEHLSPLEQSHMMPYVDFLRLKNQQICDHVGNLMNDVLDSENVFEMLVYAHRMKANVMKHMVLEFFIQNYQQLVESECMMTLPVELLVEIHRWRAAKSEN